MTDTRDFNAEWLAYWDGNPPPKLGVEPEPIEEEIDTFFDIRKTDWYNKPSFQRRLKREVMASRIAHAVTRHWRWVPVIGVPIATFWCIPVHDRTARPRAWLDAMAFSFMGDFLFWGKPMTESYFESRYIKAANRIWRFFTRG